MSISNVGAAQQLPSLNTPATILWHLKTTESPNVDHVEEQFQQLQPARMAMVIGSMSAQGLGTPALLESLMNTLRNKVSEATDDEIDMVNLVLSTIIT